MTPARSRLVSVAVATLIASMGVATSAGLLGANQQNVARAVGSPNEGSVRQATSDLRLELIGQDFSLDAGGTLHLEYRLTGDLKESADLGATTTTSSTAPPTTTVPPTTTTTTPPEPTTPSPTTSTTSTTLAPPPPPPIQLTVEVTNYAPVRSVVAVDRVVGSDASPSAFTDVIDGVAILDLREIAEFDDDGSATFTLDIETDVGDSVEEKLKFDQPGLYPIRVEVLIGDPADDVVLATAGTVVQRLPGPDDPPQLTTGIAIPATGAPPINLAVVTASTPAGIAASDREQALAVDALDEAIALAATIDSPLTLEVPPPLIARKAETPNEQQQLAEDLSNDEFVALPLAPLNISSAVAVGLSDAYASLLVAGEDLLAAAVPTTPSSRDVWLATDPLSAAGAQQLRVLGVRFVVMPSELYLETVDPNLPATDQFVEVQLPDGRTLSLLVVNDLSSQLTIEATSNILDTATPTEWAVKTIATMLIDQAQQEQQGKVSPNDDFGPTGRMTNRSRILSTPNFRAPDPRLLLELEQLANTTPGVRFVPASSLIGSTDTQTIGGQPVSVELPENAGPFLAARIDLIDSTRLLMLSAASMLPENDSRLAQWTVDLDKLISTGYTDTEVEAAAEELLNQADQLKRAVRLPEPFTFTLTGRSGTIEIRMYNDLDEPLDVLLQFSSPKVAFPQGDRVVTLRPNGETSVIVPVEARSNGTSSISVQVSTPAGEVLAEPISLTSRVTSLTGLGQVLTAGFVLVLLTWWFTHWRSKRRAELQDDGRDRHPSTSQ